MDECVKNKRLGDFSLQLTCFPDVEHSLNQLGTASFLALPEQARFDAIQALLLQLIQSAQTPCFLLKAVGEFIEKVVERKWLESYKFSHFEFWLNQKSGLSEQENYFVRAKIMGRYLPREAYQVLFPIGMGKTYAGSHYVTAHGSPDLDTTVASFWGWIDAFSARVCEGLHLWNVPGGPPDSQVEVLFLFHHLIGSSCFDAFAKTRTTLSVSAVDLIAQSGVSVKQPHDSLRKMEEDGPFRAVVLVDEAGCYLGDWKASDSESFRKVTMLFSSCLRWFISYFQHKLMQIFSQDSLICDQALLTIKQIFSCPISDSEPVKAFTQKQKQRIGDYMTKILGMKRGWDSSFAELWQAAQTLAFENFPSLQSLLSEQALLAIFDQKGHLINDRAAIFQAVEKLSSMLEKAVYSLREFADQFSIALAVKQKVLGYEDQVVGHRAELEEIRSKMGSFSYVAVTKPVAEEKDVLMGIIKASDLMKTTLGTVSLRDFCNRDETKIPAYFEVISVVDHHKSVLSTSAAPVVWIADAQSANALVADIAFSLYEKYSVAGTSEQNLAEQLQQFSLPCKTALEGRLVQSILQKQMILTL
jgi:hypothetical protein